jgi:hypothetical protein
MSQHAVQASISRWSRDCHVCQGRDQRAARWPPGYDEPALPEGLAAKDAAGPAGGGGAVMLRQQLRLRGGAAARSRRRASHGGGAADQSEAAIIGRIFQGFAEGLSANCSFQAAQCRRHPRSRGIKWRDTAIRGHRRLGTGILTNELYIGGLVWNRLRHVKDPETWRRVSRLNRLRSGSRRRYRICGSWTTRSGSA